MSRLHLIFFFLLASLCVRAQGDLGQYLRFAREQYEKGDYIYALTYYEKALAQDSETVNTLWEYAETLRAYKDYRKAEYYYRKVYQKEEAVLFPPSLLQLGLMQKQNGKYDAAIETFKLAKKKYAKNKKAYLYLKSRRELESCLWAKSAIKDTSDLVVTQLPATVNTPNSEFGHNLHDSQLIFSSLRGDSVHSNEEVYGRDYKTRLYAAPVSQGTFGEGTLIKDLFGQALNSGNGTFSLDGKRFYFSLCTDEGFNYRCKIAVATYTNGHWSAVDTLGEIINVPGSNTSMPAIASVEGLEALFFASDRPEGEGGMDLYYTFIKNGNQFSKVKPVKSANSPDNELSPFWDAASNRLYFSSSWYDGFGGYDVFYTAYKDQQFAEPLNIGLPVNSAANDVYYFTYQDTGYVSSNRLGVFYSKNPTCCSDIFAVRKPVRIVPPTVKETLADLNKRLPVTLYFHNDVPDPRSTDTVTKVNYIDSYHAYTELIPTYRKEYSAGLTGEKNADAQEDIESFFTEYVDQGVKDLELFRDLMLEELQKGTSLVLTVKGFASPLAKTNYNVNLTKRRIGSLVNYLSAYNNGVFLPYLTGSDVNGARITIREVPFGEYTANKLISDNPNDQKNSIYSRAASLERKIEIQSISILEKDSISVISTDKQLQDLGSIAPKTVVSAKFVVRNTSDRTVHFGPSDVPCDCNTARIAKNTLASGETTEVIVTFDPTNYAGKVVKSVYLKTQESTIPLRLVITGEVKP